MTVNILGVMVGMQRAAKRRGDTRSGLLTRAALDFISTSGGTFVKKEAGRQRSVHAGPIVGERTTRKAAGPTAIERAPKASVSRAKPSVAKTRKSALID